MVTDKLPIPAELLGTLMRLGHWTTLRPGVEKMSLGTGGRGEEIAFLWYSPGAHVPEHEHPGRETLFMLEGWQADENGEYGPGEVRVMEAGTRHSIHSEEGCLLLIHWEKPVKFL